MSLDIKIYKAEKKDLNSVLKIENSSFNEIDRFSKKTLIYFLNKKRLWVVKHKKNVVGYFILICYKKSVRIYSIAVEKKYRKRGVGSKILYFILRFSKFLKKEKVVLEVRKSNKSISLYKKFGFKIKRILKDYYENEDGYKMELTFKNEKKGE